jgi:hypothetical protein
MRAMRARDERRRLAHERVGVAVRARAIVEVAHGPGPASHASAIAPVRRDASQKSKIHAVSLWSDSSSGSTFSFNNAKRAFALQSQASLGSPAVSGNNVRDDE